MSKRRGNYPLELVLTAHGTAELVNNQEEILWASDDDDDFKEEFPDFLGEDDFDEVLEFLHEAQVITDKEYDKFDTEQWEMKIESLKGDTSEGLDEDEREEDD